MVEKFDLEVHPPPKEVPLSREDDSSSTTDQMPAGSIQQETRELSNRFRNTVQNKKDRGRDRDGRNEIGRT